MALILTGTPVGAQRTTIPPPEAAISIAHEIVREGVLRKGLATALPGYLIEGAALLWPGVPIVTGVERIRSVLEAQQVPPGTELMLQPLRLLVSDDGTMVLGYGVALWSQADSTPTELGRYLTAWHRVPTGWRIGALGLVELLGSRAVRWPPGLAAPRGGVGLGLIGDSARVFALADLAFADSAARGTVSSAFAHWVAPDGVTFDPKGLLRRGPVEVSAALRRLDGYNWQWGPVAAGASDDGSLGWTAGEATITVPATTEQPEQVFRTTYLTLWQRQPDGSSKFIADGGGSRP